MSWLLDRFTLRPTRHPIEMTGAERQLVLFRGQPVELFVREVNGQVGAAKPLVVLKFVGAGGRAENFSEHPLDAWSDLHGHVFAANPPGFGGSSGVATLTTMVKLGSHVLDHVQAQLPGRRILLAGSSLGAAVALGVAAKETAAASIAGLLLRDPPQLSEVIMQRFGRRTGWYPAQMIARRTPASLDAKRTATQCVAPAVFLTSGGDTVVPHSIQQAIVECYAGAKKLVHLPDADHGEPLSEGEQTRYLQALDWLKEAIYAQPRREIRRDAS